MLRRLFPHPAMTVVIPIIWLLLINRLSVAHIVLALLLGLFLPFYTRRFWPHSVRLKKPWKLLSYALLVGRDILVANVDVARLVLFKRSRDLRPAYVAVPLDIESPEAIMLFVATISLTPGTIGADLSADGRVLLVHGLNVRHPEHMPAELKQRYEWRLKEIFE